MKLMVVIFGMFLTNICVGYAPKEELCCSSDELIERTWNIVWARNVSAELSENGRKVIYSFEVIETLRGCQRERFQVEGDLLFWQTANEELSSFRGHTDEEFWKYMSMGRCPLLDDSSVNISFNVGWKYLIFLDEPFHVRGFENVSNKNDLWLIYVKQKIKEQKENELSIRIGAGRRQVAQYIRKVEKDMPVREFDEIYKKMIKYIWHHPSITNADIKRKVEEYAVSEGVGPPKSSLRD